MANIAKVSGVNSPRPHEGTHVSGGPDEIDSALAIVAMANLSSTKVWQGNVGNRPVEVAMPVATPTASGSYTGDDADDRQIAHGLGVTPKLVIIIDKTADWWYKLVSTDNGVIYWADIGASNIGNEAGLTAMDTTNFSVGKAATDDKEVANELNDVYHWVAIG